MLKRILFGIDFNGSNYANARKSIQKWWAYISQNDLFDCMIGVSNFCDRFQPLPGGDGISPNDVLKDLERVVPKKKLLQWTSDIDGLLLALVKQCNCKSVPLYSSFNYGSIINRLLILANSYGCDYMIRVDPGTKPPEGVSFAIVMGEHEKVIGEETTTVVSRMYSERLALRDLFVKSGSEKLHADLVKAYTGINVFSQVTGGAMLTQRTPGTPAICFPSGEGLTLVWGSDDSIYQQLTQTKEKSKALPSFPVERFDAVGKPKTSSEYYRGIIGAIFLKSIRDGKSITEVKDTADRFIQELIKEIIDPKKCIRMDQEINWTKYFTRNEIAPPHFLNSIIEGYRNYLDLLLEWSIICSAVKDVVVEKTKG